MKKILILGSGLVAQPIIRYLLDQNDIDGHPYQVTIASNTPERARVMAGDHSNASIVDWSVDDKAALAEMVDRHDIVVSLLPYLFHMTVATQCLVSRKNLVTTSYVKPEMQALDQEVRDAGLIFLNELGLDPGIDHMSAMRVIDHIHNNGGKVEEFYSICGALPAPEAADNPFKYKFSWSPRGVVMAGNNDGRYLKKGHIVEVPTERLFRDIFQVDFPGIGILDTYPNRNSTDYIDIYGIEEAKTIFRGTFRYQGWCEIIDAMKKLKLISSDKFKVENKSYAEFLSCVAGLNDTVDTRNKIADFLHVTVDSLPVKALEWLGWLNTDPIGEAETSSFDITADLMLEKMSLNPRERDMVVMQHTFLATYPDGKQEVIRSRMLDYGIPDGDTAIARTVALPAAIGVEMILNGEIKVKGVYRPVIREIYMPILNKLEELGIKMNEEFGLPLTERIE